MLHLFVSIEVATKSGIMEPTGQLEPEGGYLLDGRLWSDEEKLSLTLVRHSDSVLESGTK